MNINILGIELKPPNKLETITKIKKKINKQEFINWTVFEYHLRYLRHFVI